MREANISLPDQSSHPLSGKSQKYGRTKGKRNFGPGQAEKTGGIIGREEAQEAQRGAAATKDELPQKNTENAKVGKELDFNRREPERTEKEPKGKIFPGLHDSMLLHCKNGKATEGIQPQISRIPPMRGRYGGKGKADKAGGKLSEKWGQKNSRKREGVRTAERPGRMG